VDVTEVGVVARFFEREAEVVPYVFERTVKKPVGAIKDWE
jgi:hypothetical protein